MRKLMMLAVLALGLGAALLAGGQSPVLAADALEALPADAWTESHARHLLFLAGFGGDLAEVRRLHALGSAGAVTELVDYASRPALDLPPPAAAKPPEKMPSLANLSPMERQRVSQERRRVDQRELAEMRAWWVRRMSESPRPLEEKMTLFWHGLFTSGHQTVRSSHAMYEQNQLLRRHAVGNYGHLLAAIVHDPAMLRYLDNNSNVRGRPNENLAREVLELFSMGEGNYSELDIKEAARALTGYGFDRDTWTFRFVARAHDEGNKTIFGHSGNWDGDKLVELILEQPATARYIARKLFVFFVHDAPDEPTIDALAQVLRQSDYEIAPVLKTIFLSREFYRERALAAHIKSPAELVVGTVRSLPLKKVDYQALTVAMRNMGQDLFEPPNVKGWDGGRTWLNSNWLLARQNFAVALVAGTGPLGPGRGKSGQKRAASASPIDLAAICTENRLSSPGEIVTFFSRTLLPTPPSDAERAELLAAVGELPPAAKWPQHQAEINAKLQRLIVLLVSMPQYQLS
jgi:uncharacterized protein (DUF1800 family)